MHVHTFSHTACINYELTIQVTRMLYASDIDEYNYASVYDVPGRPLENGAV